jgi:hypothetical protein
MKIKMVKVYQAVYLGKKLVTHFPNQQHPNVQVKLLEGIGVQVDGDDDSIIVPYPNVAYVQLETEVAKEQKSKK